MRNKARIFISFCMQNLLPTQIQPAKPSEQTTYTEAVNKAYQEAPEAIGQFIGRHVLQAIEGAIPRGKNDQELLEYQNIANAFSIWILSRMVIAVVAESFRGIERSQLNTTEATRAHKSKMIDGMWNELENEKYFLPIFESLTSDGLTLEQTKKYYRDSIGIVFSNEDMRAPQGEETDSPDALFSTIWKQEITDHIVPPNAEDQGIVGIDREKVIRDILFEQLKTIGSAADTLNDLEDDVRDNTFFTHFTWETGLALGTALAVRLLLVGNWAGDMLTSQVESLGWPITDGSWESWTLDGLGILFSVALWFGIAKLVFRLADVTLPGTIQGIKNKIAEWREDGIPSVSENGHAVINLIWLGCLHILHCLGLVDDNGQRTF